MARKKVVLRVPTRFEYWLACQKLTIHPELKEAFRLYDVIGAYINLNPIPERLLLDLRRYWLNLLTMGLTEEEIDELVNK